MIVSAACCSIVAALIVMALPGCGAQSSADDDLVSRQEIETAFESIGEPLVVGVDMATADPDSAVDVIYSPAAQDVPNPPFEVSLFEDAKAAERQADSLRAHPVAADQVEQRKNVVLLVSRELEVARREKLIRALQEL